MSRTYTNLLYHLFFSTKERIPLIAPSFRDELHAYLGGIVRDLGGTPIEIGGVADHVHLLVKLKPTATLSDVLRELKAGSSKWLNEEKMKLHKFGWQDGYAAFSVSKSNRGLAPTAKLRRPLRGRPLRPRALSGRAIAVPFAVFGRGAAREFSRGRKPAVGGQRNDR